MMPKVEGPLPGTPGAPPNMEPAPTGIGGGPSSPMGFTPYNFGSTEEYLADRQRNFARLHGGAPTGTKTNQ